MKKIKFILQPFMFASIATATLIPLASCGSEVLVTSVSLSDTNISLGVGATVTLTPTIAPSNATNKTLKWTTSSSSIATVSSGVVTGKKAGTVTITATTTDGSNISASCKITVSAIQVTSISISQPNYLSVNNSATLSATVLPTNATNKTLTWSSSNTSVATIDSSTGVVSGLTAGETTITAAASDDSGISDSFTLTVKEVVLEGITLSPSTTTVAVGSYIKLTPSYTPSDASNKSVATWTSSDNSIATVANGIVTGNATGTVTITATDITENVSGTATVTVTNVQTEAEITGNATITSQAYTSTNASKNALLINAGSSANVSVTSSSITKSGDSSGGDDDSFYGYNSALLAEGGVQVALNNVTVESIAKGGNGIFCYGGSTKKSNGTADGTKITAKDCTVTTSKDNAGGFMTTGGGIMSLEDCSATTQGDSSAPIRTDKGGGTVTVNGGTFTSNGKGSPAIYSTADITCTDSTLVSNHSEGLIIEGGNSITLNNCNVTDTNDELNGQSSTYKNVFLYQSMSGDASSGSSTFKATGGSITTNKGDDFFCTNITTAITLENCAMTNNDTDDHYFLRAMAAAWGKSGSNGATVTLTAKDQDMVGDIYVDDISTLAMTMTNGSTYTGTINAEKNTNGCSINLASGCKLNIVNDSYVTSFTGSTDDVVLKGSGHLYKYSSGSWELVK